MTKDEIMAMKNRELDALVAEKVFKVNTVLCDGLSYSEIEYSSNIEEAWKVVENVRKNSLFSRRRIFMDALQEVTSLRNDLPKGTVISWTDLLFFITPEDICKAALLSMIKED